MNPALVRSSRTIPLALRSVSAGMLLSGFCCIDSNLAVSVRILLSSSTLSRANPVAAKPNSHKPANAFFIDRKTDPRLQTAQERGNILTEARFHTISYTCVNSQVIAEPPCDTRRTECNRTHFHPPRRAHRIGRRQPWRARLVRSGLLWENSAFTTPFPSSHER